MVVLAVSAALFFLSIPIEREPWPHCASGSSGKRDWPAWYQKQTPVPDISVFVYRYPPFNWLHPVSGVANSPKLQTKTQNYRTQKKNTKNKNTMFFNCSKPLCLVLCRTAPEYPVRHFACILVSSIPMTVSK